ncbi:MAG: [NiFe]-hydrogenase assembly chaperone HybE [Sulfuritalea sp.]|nr:[NiFe]-hydrogenase assembly chaperone HybE [Sulfuritalea sp.]
MEPTEAAFAIEAAFERIAGTRMAGLPLNNPALRVAGVGFRGLDDSHQIGVLITPWAINLVLLGDRNSRDLHLAADCRQTWDFPSGSYEFMGGDEPECGAYQFCSLFSPAFEFADQGGAVTLANEIMAELFVETPASPAGQGEAARISGRSAMQVPTSRRAFLQGMLGGRKA